LEERIDSDVDVLLVCMPFGPVFSPSIGLSLLTASLHRQHIASAITYFSIRFAELIGQHTYCGIETGERPPVVDLAGDWIFARALFDTAVAADDHHYVDRILRKREGWAADAPAPPVSEATIRRLLAARDAVEPFLEWCVHEVVAARPKVVGFTSVFQQHVASLALARRIKHASPETFIVFGGANCEGVMGAETVRQFPFVDAAVSGEAEVVFPDLVRRVLTGASLDDMQGVRTRRSIVHEFAAGVFPNGRTVASLDDLPYPDFSDYMTQFGASPFDKRWRSTFPFETSRGCWWGAKHHCTFCGLNGSSMAYRSKSAARALDELSTLTAAHPGCDIQVVDTILDMQYFKTFLPELARRRPRANLLYETKANLKKDQLRLLRDAGVSAIQPGIESFSDAVLQLMRKGVSALQNVQLLKWCKEVGVEPIWNLIWGFPGEPPEEYARMTALVGQLAHLPPPSTFAGLRLDRFSPNFDEAGPLGFTDVRPLEPYRYIYALPDEARRQLAYFFQFRHRDGRQHATEARPLLRALGAWRRQHRRSDLFSIDVDGRLLIWDFRPRAQRTLFELTGIDRSLYLACDHIADFTALAALGEDDADVRQRLDRLVFQQLLVTEHDKYLGLAIPVGEYQPPSHITARLFREIRTGARTPAGVSIRIDGRLPRSKFGAAHFSTGTDGSVLVRSVARGPA
jgi:ribosomal peptide maturation radical SAM protein 1